MNNASNIIFNYDVVKNNTFTPLNSTNTLRLKRRKVRTIKKTKLINTVLVSMLILSIILAGFMVSRFVSLRILINVKSQKIIKLEKILDANKQKNDSLENDIDTKFDYDELFNIAVMDLGMRYPGNDEVIKFDKTKSEYVRQYENIKK
ncbi:MAG: hypothetical protein Q4F88_04870 [Eubacteriales bacterium]|nr:hypothetical protein [Eubacteriales bacterium]